MSDEPNDQRQTGDSAQGATPPPPPASDPWATPQPNDPWATPPPTYGAPPQLPPPGYGQPPGYGPQGYGSGYQPAWPGQYQTAPATNGMAIASMVLGILWLYWIGSILALVFGYVARRQIDESQGRQAGRGMAVAGIVLGWVGVGVLSLVLVFGVLFGVMGAL